VSNVLLELSIFYTTRKLNINQHEINMLGLKGLIHLIKLSMFELTYVI